MDALLLLTADHNRLRSAFTRFEEAGTKDDIAIMTQLCDFILRELEVHTAIEEEIFYPAIRQLDEELAAVVAEGLEEHHVADTLMAEIKAGEPGSEQWVAKVKVLIESVEHHAGEEEEEMFPLVGEAMTAADLKDLANALEGRKAELGAPTMADKEELSLDDLRKLAREQDIPGRSTMNREELLATVEPG